MRANYRVNLFFILLASLYYYEENGDAVRETHLSFLTAYYIFAPYFFLQESPIIKPFSEKFGFLLILDFITMPATTESFPFHFITCFYHPIHTFRLK